MRMQLVDWMCPWVDGWRLATLPDGRPGDGPADSVSGASRTGLDAVAGLSGVLSRHENGVRRDA
jgi:hypothetical protein